MITLYQLPPGLDLPTSVSPYCAKLELYLRLTGRPHEAVTGNVFSSPNKKVPYVKHVDGKVQADSAEIIADLEAEGPALDDGLMSKLASRGAELVERTQGVLYYATLFARFGEPEGWVHQKLLVQGLVPWIARPLAVPMIRRSQLKVCTQAGMTGGDSYAEAVDVIDELADALGEQPYMLGEQPRTADCAIWANLMQAAWSHNKTPPRSQVRGHDNLMDYVQRLAKDAELSLPALV